MASVVSTCCLLLICFTCSVYLFEGAEANPKSFSSFGFRNSMISSKKRVSPRRKPQSYLKKAKAAPIETKQVGIPKEEVVESAFLATRNHNYLQITSSSAVVFPDVIMSRGDGYDQRTGVFTAPVDGLYAFHLTVSVGRNNGGFIVTMLAGKKVIARLIIDIKNFSDQSSVSTVAYLKAGSKVQSVGAWNGSRYKYIKGDHYSSFSGYLVQAA